MHKQDKQPLSHRARLAPQPARTFAVLVLSAFDLHRWKLYEPLRWPVPTEKGKAEIARGLMPGLRCAQAAELFKKPCALYDPSGEGVFRPHSRTPYTPRTGPVFHAVAARL